MTKHAGTDGALSFLAGGGEMGGRIRAFDWSATSLGPPQDWPQSLKTSIRIMLMSRQPVWIGWGTELLYFYNDPYLSIIGGKHPWALGRPTDEVWHEIRDVIGPMLASAMSGDEGTFVESQLLIMERNGYPEETYYTFSYSPIPDDEGRPGGIFCANSEDTQSVLGQRELGLLRELAARTAKSATPAEACAAGVAALATDPADLPFAALYLIDEDSGEAKLAGCVGIEAGHSLAPETVEMDDPRFRFGEALAGGGSEVIIGLRSEPNIPTGAWIVPPTDAIVLPLAVSGDRSNGVLLVGLSPFRLLADAYLGFLRLIAGGIASAVSDAMAAESERKRVAALAELDRAKTNFFANVSHEFRTPLTLMLGPLQDLLSQDRGVLPDHVQRELEMVRRNGLRLQKLVNALLDFSRLDARRLRATFRPLDAASITADLASSFGSVIQKAGLELVLDCPSLGAEDRPYIDQELWEKVVLNLVSNAFKHTFEGTIRVSLHRRGEAIEFSVADSGIGISKADLAQIFERFRRVDGARSRTHEGSGIGLALVQEIVALHGGAILAASEIDGPDRGTTFTVRIPLGRDHLPAGQIVEDDVLAPRSSTEATISEASRWLPDEDEGQADRVTEGAMAELRTSGARILVADDNSDMRAYITRLLAPHYSVETVADGEAALEKVRRNAPDLVVTDAMMPRLDGFGLVKAIRSEPEFAQLPIIMLSARAGEESKIEGLDSGVDDYLIKPFSSRELVARVDAALVLARMRREAGEAQRQSEERMRELFMRAPAIICVFKGPEHIFELGNPLYLELIGRSDPAEILGKPIREVLPELQGQGFFELLDGVYRTGEPFFGKEALVRLDAGESILNFVYMATRDPEGMIDGILVHAVDVTELVLARRAVEALAQELEERVDLRTSELLAANEQLQGFTYSVAHDLRQQIRGISINATLVLEDSGDKLDAGSRVHLDRLVQSARQLGALVDDLLGYARLGKSTPKMEPVDMSQLAEEVFRALMEDDLCGPETQFVLRSTPIASGDPAMLRIVLANLLGNACKYSRKADRPRVEFGQDDQGYFVRDNGVGFDMAYVHKLFQPFERLHSEDDFGGTGIGLANVRRVIEKHGGKLWAEGRPGDGATFWFALGR